MMKQKPQLPAPFRDMVASFPESSMGTSRIKLALSNGQRVYDVFVAGDGIIVKIGNKMIEKMEDLKFSPSDITNVTSEI
jgi:hypothetical protein